MTDEIKTGGLAFPFNDIGGDCYPGMTLRDYFAAKAMNGYLSNAWHAETLDSLGDSSSQQMATVAEVSYLMADAMIKARG
ncbi:TPA: hypothetical protein ACJIVJ_000495 [Yersinia enterocolitica]